MRLVSATSSSWPLPHFGILAGWQVDILKQQQHQHMQIRVGPSFRRFKFNKYANRMINKTSMCNNEGLRAAEQICFKLRISKAHSPPPLPSFAKLVINGVCYGHRRGVGGRGMQGGRLPHGLMRKSVSHTTRPRHPPSPPPLPCH